MRRTIEERFWEKVNKTDDCWEWTAHKLFNGYGRFSVHGKPDYSHRIAWQLASGKYPTGKQVLHTCDNPGCVKIDHLFLGTLRENMADRGAKNRQMNSQKFECRHGFKFSYTATNKRTAKDCVTCQKQRQYKAAGNTAHQKEKSYEYSKRYRDKQKKKRNISE